MFQIVNGAPRVDSITINLIKGSLLVRIGVNTPVVWVLPLPVLD